MYKYVTHYPQTFNFDKEKLPQKPFSTGKNHDNDIMTLNHTPSKYRTHYTGHKTNVGNTKVTTGLGNHPMVQRPHYTGDDTKLHAGQDICEDRAGIDLTPAVQ